MIVTKTGRNSKHMLFFVSVEVFYPCDSSRSYPRQALNGQPDTLQGAASNGPARPMTPQGTAWQGMVAWYLKWLWCGKTWKTYQHEKGCTALLPPTRFVVCSSHWFEPKKIWKWLWNMIFLMNTGRYNEIYSSHLSSSIRTSQHPTMPQAGFGAVDLDKVPWSWQSWERLVPWLSPMKVSTIYGFFMVWSKSTILSSTEWLFSRFSLGLLGWHFNVCVEKRIYSHFRVSPHVSLVPCEWIMTRYDFMLFRPWLLH